MTIIVGPMVDEDYVTLNRALRDERVPIHVGSDFCDVAGFRRTS